MLSSRSLDARLAGEDAEAAIEAFKQIKCQALGARARGEFGMTAAHPSTSSEDWPGYAGPMPRPAIAPLRYNWTDAPDEGNDQLILVNQVCVHCCSAYCLRKAKNGCYECRMHFGKVTK